LAAARGFRSILFKAKGLNRASDFFCIKNIIKNMGNSLGFGFRKESLLDDIMAGNASGVVPRFEVTHDII